MKENKEILIVEDEIIIAKDLQGILYKNGYIRTNIACNYEQAMLQVKNNLPDLIMCDIYLKGAKTGIDIVNELCQKIKIPVIYISAYSDENTLNNAFETNPISYITKPFTEAQILTAVKFALNEKTVDPDVQFSNITKCEREIIKLLANGLTTKEIAEFQNRSYETINNHKRNIFSKLEIHKISELVGFAIEKGLN